MALKITLKPFERIEIGPLTLTNGWIEASTFKIEGIAPVLRQANTMSEDRADTSLKRLYLCVQRLYLQRDSATIEQYHAEADRLLQEMPAAAATIGKAGDAIAEGRLYAALKAYRDLLDATETDNTWPVTAEPEPAMPRCTEKRPSVHFVRDRRRYRVGAASRTSA